MKDKNDPNGTSAANGSSEELSSVNPTDTEELSDGDLEGISGGGDGSGSGVTWNP